MVNQSHNGYGNPRKEESLSGMFIWFCFVLQDVLGGPGDSGRMPPGGANPCFCSHRQLLGTASSLVGQPLTGFLFGPHRTRGAESAVYLRIAAFETRFTQVYAVPRLIWSYCNPMLRIVD